MSTASTADNFTVGEPPAKERTSSLGLRLGVGALALIAATLIVVLVAMQSRIAPVDYLRMRSGVNKLAMAYSRVETSISDTTDTASLATASADATQAALSDALSDLKKAQGMGSQLKDLKAYEDADIAQKYLTVEKDLTAYSKYVTNLSRSIPTLDSALSACDDFSPTAGTSDPAKQVAQIDGLIGKCQTAMGGLGDVPNAEIVDFGADFGKALSKVKGITAKMVALGSTSVIEQSGTLVDKFNSLRTQLNDEASDVSTEYESDFRDLARSLHSSAAASDVEASLTVLDKAVAAKQNG